MTNRTWRFTLVTTLSILGLAACSGGGDGGGGGGIPSATNAAITPPPPTAVAITTAGGTTSQTNQSIAANSFQASNGASGTAGTAGGLAGLAGVQADNGTQAKRETLAEIVRRHAEKLKDHKSSLAGAVQVVTEPCSGSGTMTRAFDDANGSATEVFVNCNHGGIFRHGTVSSSIISVTQDLGGFVGSDYTLSVSATLAIDLAVGLSPASSVVTQGSFTFTAAFSGKMEAAPNGGVEPGTLEQLQITMSGASLLTSEGTVHERLSNFSIKVVLDLTLGTTTISGFYTYASTIIGGSVTVNIPEPQALVLQSQTTFHPSSGTVTITSPSSPGKLVLTVISSPVVGVRVDAYANAADSSATATVNLTWAEVDNL